MPSREHILTMTASPGFEGKSTEFTIDLRAVAAITFNPDTGATIFWKANAVPLTFGGIDHARAKQLMAFFETFLASDRA
jgi:hypothetical protein